jgi:predicted dithiol-disulfide oxidoreductase (DUF899 family)
MPKPNKAVSHRIVSHDAWIEARKHLLAKEKEFSHLRADLAKQRRELPWEAVEKDYIFAGPRGKESLADLFDGKSQLIVYHFMFKPEASAGCPHCSFWADHYDPMIVHLKQRDVSFVVVSRAPQSKIKPFKKRMGWKFKWLSSNGTDFNYDFQASFRSADLKSGTVFYNYVKAPAGPPDREGISAFYKDEGGKIFHTYSTYARGIDMMNGTYQFLDLAPMGRDEDPKATQAWVRYHDKY